jgi:hypothetical protein
MRYKKANKELNNPAHAGVKKEMAKPRMAKSARRARRGMLGLICVSHFEQRNVSSCANVSIPSRHRRAQTKREERSIKFPSESPKSEEES